MARVIAMYKAPTNVAAFDKYYFETHVPIAKRLPGLTKYEISRGPVSSPAGASAVHLVAILHFDDMAAIQKALVSAEGQATVADLQKFATAGVEILMFDQHEV